MVAPVMRCSTHDHMAGSPRYSVRRRGRKRDDPSRGAGVAGPADVAVVIGASKFGDDPLHPASPRLRSSRTDLVPTRRARLRRTCDRHATSLSGTVGGTLNPFVVLNEPSA